MHLRGKAMSMEAILPDGTIQHDQLRGSLQLQLDELYQYTNDAAPVLPKGTIIGSRRTTTTRPQTRNPDPSQWVGYGDRTVDEMGHAWVNVTYISDAEYNDWAAKHKAKGTANGGGQ